MSIAFNSELSIGEEIYSLAKRLWPINRSLTGDGVRQTLSILKEFLPNIKTYEIASGTQVFDWTVPLEWNVAEAWIKRPDGTKLVDYAINNLHLVGYSTPIDITLNLDELQSRLHSLPDQPDAIPYITSYYEERWGFCLRHSDRVALKPGNYQIRIDATLKQGSLTYGELIIPGDTVEEIFLSTYICHPSLANNELSGVCVTTYLGRWLNGLRHRKYTYRIVFIPETIGSISYLSRHLDHLKKKVIAGFNITCVGDERGYSYLPSRAGNTLADRAALHVLKHQAPNFIRYTYLDRGSDERQYCAPGIDLPIATIMRTKYGEYPEYHTSLDDLSLVTSSGLEGAFIALRRAIEVIEKNCSPKVLTLGEPQLGKRGLYATLSTTGSTNTAKRMMDLLAYCDGENTILEIAEIIEAPAWELLPVLKELISHGLISIVK